MSMNYKYSRIVFCFFLLYLEGGKKGILESGGGRYLERRKHNPFGWVPWYLSLQSRVARTGFVCACYVCPFSSHFFWTPTSSGVCGHTNRGSHGRKVTHEFCLFFFPTLLLRYLPYSLSPEKFDRLFPFFGVHLRRVAVCTLRN